jgi:RND family efflux transporter MFP subunit
MRPEVAIMQLRLVSVLMSCVWLALAGEISRAADEPPAKPPEVPVALPLVREVTDHEDFTGRTNAASSVELRARVTGYLLKSAFQEGAEVKQGDLLFEIDPRPYKAEMEKAQAEVLQAEAQLKAAEASFARARALHNQKIVGQDEFDKVAAERVVAEARLRAVKASLDVAQLNLDFTKVTSPITGQIGRRLFDPGNLVKADETILATVVSRDPIYVYFDVDERTYLRLRKAGLEGKRQGEKLPVQIGLADEKGFPHRGSVNFTNSQVDPNTGTLQVRAVLPNERGLLVPGLFVRVRLAVGEPYKALLIPEQAVMVEEGGRSVFVVTDKDVIERRQVVVGRDHDGLKVVIRGLRPEDRVVTGRLQGLRPGMTIRPVLGEQPAPKPEGTPEGGRQSAAPPGRGQAGPGIRVEAVYPGANAQVVRDTVGSPIEQQISGVERLLSLRSRCTNDGKYTLLVSFGRGADPDMSQVLVQNRVALATPVIPTAVQQDGIVVRKEAAGVLMIVTLSSPDGSYDALYLSNYLNIQIKDELVRVEGMGAVSILGPAEHGLRILLDPDKLAARGLNAGEVLKTIEKEKEAGEAGPDKLSDLILKADGEGRLIRLRDVATVEMHTTRRHCQASFNGKPVVALALHPMGHVLPRKVSAAIRDRLADLRPHLPKGLDLSVAFDFTANLESPELLKTPEYLLLDVDMPPGSSDQHTQRLLDSCQTLLGQQHGIQDVLAMTENPFDLFGGGPCLLVRLSPAENRNASREKIIQSLRTRLEEIKDARPRLRDLSGPRRFPRCGYPIDLAVCGPELDRVREMARKLTELLERSKMLTDVWMSPCATPQPQVTVEIDRAAAAVRGVSMEDISTTLRVQVGASPVNDFNRFGRTWQMTVQTMPGSGGLARDIQQLKVRSSRGQMIPLGALVQVREVAAPQALDFLDFQSMVEITANHGTGVSAAQARSLCEKLGEGVRKELGLPGEYRVRWLPDITGSR